MDEFALRAIARDDVRAILTSLNRVFPRVEQEFTFGLIRSMALEAGALENGLNILCEIYLARRRRWQFGNIYRRALSRHERGKNNQKTSGLCHLPHFDAVNQRNLQSITESPDYTFPIHFRSSHTALIEVRFRRSKTFLAAAKIFPRFKLL